MSTSSMTGYDTAATVYPTPQYGYEGKSQLTPVWVLTDLTTLQGTPDRRDGGESSTLVTTSSSSLARALLQTDTTTTIIGERITPLLNNNRPSRFF